MQVGKDIISFFFPSVVLNGIGILHLLPVLHTHISYELFSASGREKEREGEREGGREREGGGERERVFCCRDRRPPWSLMFSKVTKTTSAKICV